MIDIKTVKAGEDVQEGVTYRYDISDGEYIILRRWHWYINRNGERRVDSIETTIDTGTPRLGSKERREPSISVPSLSDHTPSAVEEYANLLLEAVALARSLK